MDEKMSITEAKDILQAFCDIYAARQLSMYPSLSHTLRPDYLATKLILEHVNYLEREVSKLAIESTRRTLDLIKLESTVKFIYSKLNSSPINPDPEKL